MRPNGPTHRISARLLGLLLLTFSVALLNGCAGIVKTASQTVAGLFQLNPTSVNFGTVTVGKKTTQSVSISNTGAVAVNITQATFSNSQFSLSGTTLPMALPAGQSGTLTLGITPAAAGNVTGTMTVTGDSGSTPATVNLSANAVGTSQPQLSVSPSSISFGTVSVGSHSTSNLVLSNTGTANLTVSVITLSGSEFGISGVTTPATLSAGQSVQATMTFAPTTAAAATGSVTITSNDPNNPTATIPLSGTGSSAPTGQLSATPASINFGNIAVGTSANQQIVVTNTGNAAVHLSSVSATGSAYKVSGVATPATVNPSSSVTLTCTFAPSAPGSTTGSITIASDAGNSSLAIALNGVGTEGTLSISPSSFNFGSIIDGQSKSQSFTVTNTGTAALTISQISATGASFSVSGLSTPATLVAGASASFSALFSPTTVGNLTGNLTITSSDAGNPTMNVPLSGIGTAVPTGQLSAAPASVNFGTVAVGASANQAIVLSNTGNAAVHISSFAVSGTAYQVSGVTAPMTINPASSVTLTSSFTPTTTGSATGSLTVASDATDSSLAISLNGTGAQAGVSVSPTTYNFGSIVQGQTKSQPFVLTNTGTAPLTISQISVSGGTFSVSGLTTPATVAAGGTASFNVLFAPSTSGSAAGTVTVTSNAPNSPSTIALTGTGVAATVTLSASPATLNFGNINAGSSSSQTVTLTNSGNSTVTISQVTVNAANFTATGITAPSTLAAGQSTPMNVTFSPTSTENVTGNITVSSSQGASAVVAVSGSGVQPAISITPASFNFGSIVDGQTKSQSFTVTNTGTAALTISQISATGSGFSASGLTVPAAVPVGGTATFAVQFAPTTAGSLTGTVNIASNAPSSPTAVALSGTGTAATVTLSANPTSLSFAGINVGSSSSQTVTITNTGNSSAVISQVSVGAKDFATSGLTPPMTLAPGQSSTLNVTFSPTTSENITGNITVSTSQGTSAVISVSGGSVQPAISVTPVSYSFGNVVDGQTKSQAFTITNTGTATLTVSQLSVTGGAFSVSGLATPATIPAGSTETFDVQFAPTTVGSLTGTVSITSNAPSSPTVALSGTGTAAVVTLTTSPSSLSFSNINVGSSSTQAVTITNTGNASATISQVSVSAKDFSTSGVTAATTLAAGQSATLSVTFSPSASENVTGNITVSTSQGPSAVVSVSGNGIQPALTVTPASASFGNVTVGVSSTQPIQVTNSGTGTLSVTQVNVAGSGFSTSSLSLPISLAAGQSSSFNVQFLPASAGAATGSLSIVSNAPNSPATVPLSGTGVAQTLTLSYSTTNLAFGNVNTGSSSTLPVTITNTGNGSVQISQISQSGTGFSVTGSNTPVTLAPNQTLTFNVVFSPTAAGSDSGSVTVASNATGSPATISLSGTGVQAATYAVALTWTASTSAVSGYNVYRSTSSGSGYVKLNNSLIATVTYTDSTVASGTTYYYVTTAVDASGYESGDSNQATAVIP